jgi:hypothetical protein
MGWGSSGHSGSSLARRLYLVGRQHAALRRDVRLDETSDAAATRSAVRRLKSRVANHRPLFRVPAVISLVAHLLFLVSLAWIGLSRPTESTAILIDSVFADTNSSTPTMMIEFEALAEPIELPAEALLVAPESAASMAAPQIDAPTAPVVGELAVGQPTETIRVPLVGSEVGLYAEGTFGTENGRRPTSFFGLPSRGTNFVFLVDSSGSMGGSRLQLAKRELFRTMQNLGDKRRFHVIFFDQNLHILQLPTAPRPSDRPISATAEHIGGLRRWMSTIATDRGRHPMAALEMALEMLPDAVFLLSDGDFPDWILERVHDVNLIDEPGCDPRAAVIIHTVLILPAGRSEATKSAEAKRMHQLAQQNEGNFRIVVHASR